MGIGNEIQQTSFRSENHKALVNIIFSSNWLLEKIRLILEQEDISHQQYNILRILKGAYRPMSTLQIRARMLDRMSDTSRIVERLLKKELVNKMVCPGDKRLVDITISDKGLALLERLEEGSLAMDRITSMLDDEEVQTLNLLLDKMRGSTPDPSQ